MASVEFYNSLSFYQRRIHIKFLGNHVQEFSVPVPTYNNNDRDPSSYCFLYEHSQGDYVRQLVIFSLTRIVRKVAIPQYSIKDVPSRFGIKELQTDACRPEVVLYEPPGSVVRQLR